MLIIKEGCEFLHNRHNSSFCTIDTIPLPTQPTQFFLHNRHNSSSYTTDTILLSTQSTQFLFLHNQHNSSFYTIDTIPLPTQSTQFLFLRNRHNSSSYTIDTIPLPTQSTQFLFLHNRGNSSSKLNSHNFGEFSFLRNVKTRLLSCTLYQPNRPLRVKRHNSNYHSKIPNSNNGTLPARNVSCNISTQHSFSHADDLCQLMTRCKIFHENLIIMHPVIKLSAAKQRKKLYYRVLSNEPLYPRHIQTHPAHTLNTYHVRTHVNPLNPLAG